MKLFKINLAILGNAALLLSLAGCKKYADSKITYETDMGNKSLVRVYVATVNASRNYVYVDGTPVTGALLTSGSVFPASGIGAAAINPGLKAFLVRDTLPTSTQVALSFAENLQTAKSYTIFTYDTINSPKQKTVLDDLTQPTDTTARIRFGHFAYSPVAIPNVDIYSKRRGANLFSNVALTDVTGFLPIASNLTDTLIVRVAGSGVNLTNTAAGTPITTPDVQLIITPAPKRLYTLVFRGGYRSTYTSIATVRTLSVFTQL